MAAEAVAREEKAAAEEAARQDAAAAEETARQEAIVRQQEAAALAEQHRVEHEALLARQDEIAQQHHDEVVELQKVKQLELAACAERE